MLTTNQQIQEVVRLRDDEDKTFAQVAEIMQFSERTARRRYEAGVLMGAVDHLVSEDLEEFPETKKLEIDVSGPYLAENKGPIERFEPLVRTGDAIVACDLHIPLHDPGLINVMVNAARDNDIKSLIVAGDYFNMDSFSSYLPHQPEADIDIERYDGNLIMKTLLETFDEIDFIWGNHDFRLTRKLGFKKSFEECMRWMLSELTKEEMSKIRFSDLDYMHFFPEVSLAGRHYRICHPGNFSSTPLTVARKLAVKYNCSIITAHSHHCAIGAAPNGKDICIEGGGFFDKRRTEYIQRSTTHHEWVQGFTIFKEGLPTVVSPTFGNDRQYRREITNV